MFILETASEQSLIFQGTSGGEDTNYAKTLSFGKRNLQS